MSDANQDTTTISLAYSVDADDAFMFHALRTGALDTGPFRFVHSRAHTAALNQLAIDAGADVVAVSVGVYPAIAARYQMLPHGASVGRGFGPVVVARRPLAPADLAGLRVGIPGATTTAWLVLRLIAPGAVGVEIPISPFGAIFDALDSGAVDAALLIHEGRMLYRERGLHLVRRSRRMVAGRRGAAAAAGRERDSPRAGRGARGRGVGPVAREHRLGARPPRSRSST